VLRYLLQQHHDPAGEIGTDDLVVRRAAGVDVKNVAAACLAKSRRHREAKREHGGESNARRGGNSVVDAPPHPLLPLNNDRSSCSR
jgi:hypothetical protein